MANTMATASSVEQKRRIVIVGGGFAGVFAARELQRRLPTTRYQIELISARNYFVFQPLLPEVAAGTINSQDAVAPLRALLPGVRVREAEVISADRNNQQIAYLHGRRRRALTLGYDHLILAGGQSYRPDMMAGFLSHSLPMRDLNDAYRLRNHVIGCLELADATDDPVIRQEALTFVVAGGGFSGVETTGELVEMIRRACRYYPSIKDVEVRFHIIHSGAHLLPEMSLKLGQYAEQHLKRHGVKIQLNTRLTGATSHAVHTDQGQIQCRTLVSTIGSGPSPLAEKLGLPLRRGRIITDSSLRVSGEQCIWAIGDIAAIPLASDRIAPPTAQFAIREARVLAGNVQRLEQGKALKPFHYQPLGSMASLGHYSAVASVCGIHFQGLFAWLLWRTFYIAILPGFATRLRVMLNWAFDYFLPRNIVNMGEPEPRGCEERVYNAGDVLFRKGQFLDGFYTVIDGQLEFDGERQDGEQVRKIINPGDHWGEWILDHGGITTGTLCAVSTSRVLVMASSDFRLLRKTLPAFERYFATIPEQHYSRSLTSGLAAPENPQSISE